MNFFNFIKNIFGTTIMTPQIETETFNSEVEWEDFTIFNSWIPQKCGDDCFGEGPKSYPCTMEFVITNDDRFVSRFIY